MQKYILKYELTRRFVRWFKSATETFLKKIKFLILKMFNENFKQIKLYVK